MDYRDHSLQRLRASLISNIRAHAIFSLQHLHRFELDYTDDSVRRARSETALKSAFYHHTPHIYFPHAVRVGKYASNIAGVLGLTPGGVDFLRRGGELHDIGKLLINQELLHSEKIYDDDQKAEVAKHIQYGAEILTECGLPELAKIALHHHDEVIEDDAVRLIAVADRYDAMQVPRPYHAGTRPEEVIEILREEFFGDDFVEALATSLSLAPRRPLLPAYSGAVIHFSSKNEVDKIA